MEWREIFTPTIPKIILTSALLALFFLDKILPIAALITIVWSFIVFLPIQVFIAIGMLTFGMGDDYIYLPSFWQFLSYIFAIIYSYFLSGMLLSRATKARAINFMILLTAVSSFLTGTLWIIWQIAPYAVEPLKSQQLYFMPLAIAVLYYAFTVLLYKYRNNISSILSTEE